MYSATGFTDVLQQIARITRPTSSERTASEPSLADQDPASVNDYQDEEEAREPSLADQDPAGVNDDQDYEEDVADPSDRLQSSNRALPVTNNGQHEVLGADSPARSSQSSEYEGPQPARQGAPPSRQNQPGKRLTRSNAQLPEPSVPHRGYKLWGFPRKASCIVLAPVEGSLAGQWKELRCCICHGNTIRGAGPAKGMMGFQRHIKRAHGQTLSNEDIVERCAIRTLTEDEVKEIDDMEFELEPIEHIEFAQASFSQQGESDPPTRKQLARVRGDL